MLEWNLPGLDDAGVGDIHCGAEHAHETGAGVAIGIDDQDKLTARTAEQIVVAAR
jgi:hypothetical protein